MFTLVGSIIAGCPVQLSLFILLCGHAHKTDKHGANPVTTNKEHHLYYGFSLIDPIFSTTLQFMVLVYLIYHYKYK